MTMSSTVAVQRKVVELPALRIDQQGTGLYLTSLRAGDLVNGMTQVDAWTPTNREGYQRMPVKARFRKIAQYALGKEGGRPILPQAVVLNADEEGGMGFRDPGAG